MVAGLFFIGVVLYAYMTIQKITELLDYNSETGVFTWKVMRGGKRSGTRAGTEIRIPQRHGLQIYRSIRLNKRHYLEHRLAWRIVYGDIPSGMQIDHINRNPSDNRISNLRLVTQSANNMNTKLHGNNTSGIRGVSWHKQIKRWIAELRWNGKKYHIGCYVSKDEAAAARKEAEERICV